MNQLLPIVRRVRRPLVVNDAPVAVVGNVECVPHGQTEMVNEVFGETPETTGETMAAPLATVPPINENHAKPAHKRKAR